MTGELTLQALVVPPEQSVQAQVYSSLVLGVRDYVNKNGFSGVVLGLSGGIDSALTLAIAVDALGKDRVQAVMMPFEYTSQLSLECAASQAESLGVNYQVIAINEIYEKFMAALAREFAGTEPGVRRSAPGSAGNLLRWRGTQCCRSIRGPHPRARGW